MVQYFENNNIAIFNDFCFRRDKKTNYYLSSSNIGNKRKRLHVYVWEYYNGNIPIGYHVHHKDENKFNNEISNLEILTGSQHSKLHGSELTEEKKIIMRKNLIENAIPKSKEWHKTEAGRIFHKKHYENVLKNRKKEKLICSHCGNNFEAFTNPTRNNNFCSNACKSAYRRNSGLDNIECECVICKSIFIKNKYNKKETCSRSCATVLGHKTIKNYS